MIGILASAFLFAQVAADPVPPEETPRACTVRELDDARLSGSANELLVATGVVQAVESHDFIIEDETGCVKFRRGHVPLPRIGDRIEIVCLRYTLFDYDRQLFARRIKVIGRGVVSPPLAKRICDIDERFDDTRLIATTGMVISVYQDPVDTNLDILLLKDGPARLPLFLPASPANAALNGARIRVTARYYRLVSGVRRFSGPYLEGKPEAIEVLCPPPDDPFDVPRLDPRRYITPRTVAAMDLRALDGRVLACWDGNKVLLGVKDLFATVRLASGEPLPKIGETIRAVGCPETDLLKVNLADARWQRRPEQEPPRPETPRAIVPEQIFRLHNGRPEIDSAFDGRLIRIVGITRGIPSADDNLRRRFFIDAGEHCIPVDFSACPETLNGLRSGCTVEVTGRCLLEVAAWQPHDVVPPISGVAIILRTADDLRILSRPPWWTPARLLWVIGALAVLLVGVVFWNRLLNRLVERRGRQLYRADIARAGEALRVEERTRLAVELHDSLSQYLTGVALQIKAGRHELAARVLKSCRDELRNCLWDLRSNAIDADSMDEAIRQTLAPHVEDVSFGLRFNVPRKSLSDNTAYAILRIIRELVVNAIRHGEATGIRIAGTLEPDRLLFSVKDDGRGFDPENRPGIGEGHFGLQGVTERVASLGGEISIESRPGEGTKVVITLPIAGATAVRSKK